MSNVNEIQFAVEKSVLDIGVKIVFPVIEGIDNTLISPEWMEKRKEIVAHLLDEYKDIDYHADPILEGFHILHDRTGVKRRKNIPASENLIRLLNKHGDVFLSTRRWTFTTSFPWKASLHWGRMILTMWTET